MATKTSQAKAPPEQVLAGKTAVITGAARGLGKAIAVTFARAGACSILVVRDRGAGEEIVKQLLAEGLRADVGVADVTDVSQISMLALAISQRSPSIDILVNNAGIFLDEDRQLHPSNLDLSVLEQTLNVNLYGPIRMCNALIPHMPRGGRIINVSSTMGQLSGEPDSYGTAYSISKTALNMYTQMLAAELRDRQFMVDVFHPGWVKTDMGGKNATIEPEDAAKTALFLASRPQSEKTGLFWRGQQVIDW